MNDKYITFFVSTDAHDRLIRRMWKKVGQCKGSIFALSLLSGVSLAMILELKRRVDELEARLNKE